MLHPTLLLLLLVSFAAPTPAQADSVLYVKPTEGTECPGEPCHTLDWYVNETNHNNDFPYNNTLMKFLPGTHNLGEGFNFHNLTNLTLEATNPAINETHPAMNETVIFCSDQALFFSHGSHISIERLSIVNCSGGDSLDTLRFRNCAYIRISRVTIEVLGNISVVGNYTAGIVGLTVHSINVSQVSIHILEGNNVGIYLGDITGNCILEEVEVISLDSRNIAVVISPPCELHDQSQYIIRRCSFELLVVILASDDNCQSTNHLVILENVIFKNIGYIGLGLGKALDLEGSTSVLLRNVTFANNTYSGTSVAGAAVVEIRNAKNVTFIDCEFYNNLGTPISADQGSSLQFSGTIVFWNNTGYDGGAMSITGGSYVIVSNHANVIFENNTAENAGGAVFVDQDTRYCFFRLSQGGPHNCAHLPFNLSFINNTALKGGDAIYGADIRDCIYLGKYYSANCNARELLQSANSGLYFEPDLDSDPSQISSDPTRVCLCENGTLNCSITSWSETCYPGEEFTISAIDVGDTRGPVDGSVYAQLLPQYEGVLGGLQYSQEVTRTKCTELRYSLLFKPGLVVMALTVNTARVPKYQDDGNVLYINVTLLPCPLGFDLSAYPHQCICDTQLKRNNIPCNITTQTIQRSGSVWVNASFDANINNGEIVHKNCPFGYCITEEVHVNLKQPDTQCAFNHSGTLCGACQPGLSLALGSPQCISHCSNSYTSLLIAFAIAGLVLVFFIKILDLTVAVGTINGLIFYANIIQAAQSTFLSEGDANPLTVFIAWLNLDLGIETCFFHGLDGYWKTWLQFVFPFYIWAIILLIIYVSRCSQAVARIFGNNSVPVLATLILLSYAKLFRTIVSALTFTYLEFPDGSKTAVWSIDGNIQYLGPKHIPLLLFAVGVLLFLWLPFTVLLLFEQCFQRIGAYTVRKWMLRLKPFFDAYFGPLRGNYRYWIGVLLVARGILLLVFGPLNFTDSPSVNLLAVIIVVLLLVMYTNNLPHGHTDMDGGNHFRFWIGSCYKKWYLSLLESSFLCNLAILSAITLAIGKQTAVVYTSVGIAFCQFIGMVIYQAYVMIRRSWERGGAREEVQLGEVGGAQVNREDYEPINEHHMRERWPPEARYDQCREPQLEEN